MKQGGAIANRTGNNLESTVRGIIEREGYNYVDKDKFTLRKLTDSLSTHRIKFFTTQFNLCNGIYPNARTHCDFMLYDSEKYRDNLIIECKWQQSSGSADEKFVYLERNIRENYPHNTIVVLDGKGCRDGAEKWLRSQVGGKFLGVYSLNELMMNVDTLL